jgi:hypothetical protein
MTELEADNDPGSLGARLDPSNGEKAADTDGRKPRAESSLRIEPKWIGWILALGAALRLMWLALGLVRLRVFRRHAHKPLKEPPDIEEMQLRTWVRASVMFSPEIDSP